MLCLTPPISVIQYHLKFLPVVCYTSNQSDQINLLKNIPFLIFHINIDHESLKPK